MRDLLLYYAKRISALIFGLKHYRQYLLGCKFKVRSDHAALRYLRSATELIGQQGRWLATLEEFDFELAHRAGLLHGNADSMSRKTPCEEGGEPCPQCAKWRPGENITDEDFTMDNGQQYLSCFATHSTGALKQGTEVESLSVSTGAMKQGPGLETPITSTGAMKQGPELQTPITSTGAMKQGPGLETPITYTGAMKQGPGLETPITSTGAMKQGPGLETPITSTGAMKQGPGAKPLFISTHVCGTCGVEERDLEEYVSQPPRASCGAVQTRARGHREVGKYLFPEAAPEATPVRGKEEAGKIKKNLMIDTIHPKREEGGSHPPLTKRGKGRPKKIPPSMPSVEEVEEAAIDLETDILESTINETLTVQPMQDTGQPGRAKPGTPEEGRRGSGILQPSTPSQSLRAKRKLKREAAEQRTLAAWDDEFIAKAQEKCPEVGPIRSWLIENVKPDWSNVRGESPAAKAYYQQYTSLYVRGNVLYQRLEKEEAKSEPTSRLVIPRSLKNE